MPVRPERRLIGIIGAAVIGIGVLSVGITMLGRSDTDEPLRTRLPPPVFTLPPQPLSSISPNVGSASPTQTP
jgi:hypothetical protein